MKIEYKRDANGNERIIVQDLEYMDDRGIGDRNAYYSALRLFRGEPIKDKKKIMTAKAETKSNGGLEIKISIIGV